MTKLLHKSAKHPADCTLTELLDNLNFTDSAKQLEALKALIFSAPEDNQKKIEFLKEEISAGRYEINSQRIAAKFIEYNRCLEPGEVV